MTWLEFILAALVVYRLSMLIAVEQGPAKLFSKFRKLPPKRSSAREGLSCPHCVGLWVSAFVAVLLAIWKHYDWKDGILLAFALAGASSFMVRIGRAPE